MGCYDHEFWNPKKQNKMITDVMTEKIDPKILRPEEAFFLAVGSRVKNGKVGDILLVVDCG